MPPAVREAEFLALETAADEEEIKQRFNSFVRSLHSYLNQVPCLLDIQQTRLRWRARTSEAEAFGNFAADPWHWYTFHHGGRNEAQFNVGLWPSYMRVGLGFEFTLKKHGDPTAVQLAYSCFRRIIEGEQRQFADFVAEQELEIEWADSNDGPVLQVPTGEVVQWLLALPEEPRWILVGRLLRRDRDANLLADPIGLGNRMQNVLCGFRPIWERTQLMAHA